MKTPDWYQTFISALERSYREFPNVAANVFGDICKAGGLVKLKPNERLELSLQKFTPANRVRSRKIEGHGTPVTVTSSRVSTTTSRPITYINPNAPEFSSSLFTSATSTAGYLPTVSPDTISDTTKRTRPLGEEYGTCQYTKVLHHGTTRVHTWNDSKSTTYLEVTGVGLQYAISSSQRKVVVGPYPGYLSDTQANSLRASELSTLTNHISKHGLRMIREALPNHRDMGLFRSIAELKDLPKTVKGTLDALNSVRLMQPRSSSAIGGDYLNWQFGIDPIISDVLKLLKLANTLPKRIAYLQSRHLKDTTFHSHFRFSESGGSTTLSMPYNSSLEALVTSGSKNVRDVSLRATVNCNVRFPDIESGVPPGPSVPRLLGLQPSIADLYKLVPWTWLIDWYFGLGEYLETLAQFNEDPSIFNWGCVVGKSKNSLNTSIKLRYASAVSTRYGVQTPITSTTYEYVTACSCVDVEAYKRVDASTLPNVACTSTMTGLSPWQLSIIGALLTNRYT